MKCTFPVSRICSTSSGIEVDGGVAESAVYDFCAMNVIEFSDV